MSDGPDRFDEELKRLLREAGVPDDVMQPTSKESEPPIFEREKIKPEEGNRTAARGVAKVTSRTTMKRAATAHGRGVAMFFGWAYEYYTAHDKRDLRVKNPRAHHEITMDRRRRFLIGFSAFMLMSLIIFYAVGILGTVCELVSLFGILMLVGRDGKPIIDSKAGQDLGMGETRVQRAIARAVFGINVDDERFKDWYKNIIIRDGWTKVEGSDTRTIRIGLPYPHNSAKAKLRLRDIAAALDLPSAQIRIVEDPSSENAGDFDLIVYGNDPWNIAPTLLAVAKSPVQTNAWDGIDLGYDIDRKQVFISIIGKSILIGGLPDMGKTTTGLTILSSLVLDPYVRLWVADAKGVDTAPLVPLAYRYVGASQEDMVEMLDEIEAWGRKKLAALKDIGKQKMTRDLSMMWRQVSSNHPLAVVDVIYIDECRFYTNGSIVLLNNKIVERVSRIIEMFRAAGIVVIIATQRPSAKNIPSEIRDLLRIRLAHACTTPTMSNFILGEGAAGLGYSAHVFDESWQGVCWLHVLKSFVQMRPHLTEYDDLDRCCKFAYEMRKELGTLPDQVDESGANDVPQILLDIESILVKNEWDKIPTYVLIPLLTKMAPSYDGMSAPELASKLANWGLGPNGIGEWTFDDGKVSPNVRGYRISWVWEAIEKAKKGSIKQ